MRLLNRFSVLVLLCLFALPAWATTTVTGQLQNLGTGAVGANAFVRFWLRGCGGNQPTVSGSGLIAPTSGGVYFFDMVASATGAISGILYSTRDSTGLLGGDISCGGSTLAVWYGMQVFVAGKGGPEIPIHAKNSVTLNINSVTPITSNPVVPSPTGDSTYARLDAGNMPFTGQIQAPSALIPILNGPVTLSGNLTATGGGALSGGFTGQFTSIGNTTPGTGAFTTLNAANAGVFTNIQQNEYLTSIINSIVLGTEYNAAQGGGNFATDALAGGISTPVGSTVRQVNAIAGYANNSSTSTNAVAGYFQNRCLANSTKCWGINTVTRDVPSLNNALALYGIEVDVNPFQTSYSGGGVFGVIANINTGAAPSLTVGTAFYAYAGDAFKQWNHGFETQSGGVSLAFLSGALCTSGSCNSQGIRFDSLNAGLTVSTAITGDSFGDIVLSPIAAAGIRHNGFDFMPEIATPGGVNNQDFLWGDSTAHRWKMNNNNTGADVVVGAATTDTFSNKSTASGPLTGVVASGTSTLTSNAALGATTSQAAITTTATGTLTTDAIEWSYASALGAGDSLCIIQPYVTSGNVNFVRSNPTAAAQNVSAIVINWRVIR